MSGWFYMHNTFSRGGAEEVQRRRGGGGGQVLPDRQQGSARDSLTFELRVVVNNDGM